MNLIFRFVLITVVAAGMVACNSKHPGGGGTGSGGSTSGGGSAGSGGGSTGLGGGSAGSGGSSTGLGGGSAGSGGGSGCDSDLPKFMKADPDAVKKATAAIASSELTKHAVSVHPLVPPATLDADRTQFFVHTGAFLHEVEWSLISVVEDNQGAFKLNANTKLNRNIRGLEYRSVKRAHSTTAPGKFILTDYRIDQGQYNSALKGLAAERLTEDIKDFNAKIATPTDRTLYLNTTHFLRDPNLASWWKPRAPIHGAVTVHTVNIALAELYAMLGPAEAGKSEYNSRAGLAQGPFRGSANYLELWMGQLWRNFADAYVGAALTNIPIFLRLVGVVNALKTMPPSSAKTKLLKDIKHMIFSEHGDCQFMILRGLSRIELRISLDGILQKMAVSDKSSLDEAAQNAALAAEKAAVLPIERELVSAAIAHFKLARVTDSVVTGISEPEAILLAEVALKDVLQLTTMTTEVTPFTPNIDKAVAGTPYGTPEFLGGRQLDKTFYGMTASYFDRKEVNPTTIARAAQNWDLGDGLAPWQNFVKMAYYDAPEVKNYLDAVILQLGTEQEQTHAAQVLAAFYITKFLAAMVKYGYASARPDYHLPASWRS